MACARFLKAMPAARSDQSLWKALHAVIEGMWLGAFLTMRQVEEMQALHNLRIRIPESKEATADLEVCAKRDIGKRQTRSVDKWKFFKAKTSGRHPEFADSDSEDRHSASGNQLCATWPPRQRGKTY